jgi:pyridoxamine 5'-phosphate oxidase
VNPITRIIDDRNEARKLGDSNADTCFLALADKQGQASVRTLVLRNISDNRFTLFVNRTSPKWQLLQAGASYELLLWYPSMQRQYRVGGSMLEIDPTLVKTNWMRRPLGSKLLDHAYHSMSAQSGEIDSRNALVTEIARLRQTHKIDDVAAPEGVGGVELIATRIEMLDLNSNDRIHDRQIFRLHEDSWQARVLMP